MADKRITDVDIIESLDSNESFFVNKNNSIKQIKKEDIIFGIVNGGTGATNAVEARKNLGAISITNYVVELSTGKWTNNEQTASVGEATTDNTVIVAPEASTNNYKTYSECGIRCTAQEKGILTFSCEEVPTINIFVNVAVFS